ncbi:MAG TPA: exodeoxyribonuclease V subunit gamma, partial [Polyangiaceae bacterium]|nr:exodeoxyribonuclease V subunit gamma [Polyangiaceae bacterium]
MDRRATGLVIYRSNRLERLATSLGDLLSTPTDDAFAPECILVPGRGVAQWLSFELSRTFGVWANVLYLYPRNFVAWALERVLGKPLEELQAFDPERLLWSICATLPTLFELPEFEPIRRYVASDTGDLRFFELCRRIAATFDRYAAYRPELLAGWERKSRGSGSEAAPQLALFGGSSTNSEGWQPILWRALLERAGGVPAGSLERTFARALRQAARVEKLPRRISCFGVTHLPPTYTRILVALGAHIPLHVFQLSPSERAPALVEPSAGRTRPPSHPSRPNNPLLASLGTLAMDFESVLEQELSRQSVASESRAAYVEPTGQTRLERLQRQLLVDQSLRTRGPARATAAGEQAPDESIQIHVCHSPMREVEVLYDQLMALLASGTGLEARDVVVLTPDIETYAPLIEAVFRRASDDPHRIPYCIADRTLEASAPVATALDRLFGLARERLSTSQVLDLLALEPIAQRFEISSRDHEQITEWLTRTNVRWGIDAEHRQAHGHPAADANTWRLGLERLFLGYAMTNDPPALVSGVLPESGAGGSEAATLGKLATFLEALFTHVAALGTPRPAAEWPAVVGAALDALVLNDAETAWQHRELRDCLAALARRAETAGYGAPLSGIALRSLLFEAAESARPARGFLMGGVTFCSMVPLRSLPFR